MTLVAEMGGLYGCRPVATEASRFEPLGGLEGRLAHVYPVAAALLALVGCKRAGDAAIAAPRPGLCVWFQLVLAPATPWPRGPACECKEPCSCGCGLWFPAHTAPQGTVLPSTVYTVVYTGTGYRCPGPSAEIKQALPSSNAWSARSVCHDDLLQVCANRSPPPQCCACGAAVALTWTACPVEVAPGRLPLPFSQLPSCHLRPLPAG